MRLYLSSFQLGNCPDVLVNMAGSNRRVAVIMNACDGCLPEERSVYLEKQKRDMLGLGLEPEELDLREYFGKPEALRDVLQNIGIVWVNGGNVFVLKRAYEQSGFDEIITSRLVSDGVVYGGYSAGICVLAPTLSGLDLCDSPTVLPSGYAPEVNGKGLGVIKYSILPHYKSDHPETALIDAIEEYMKKNNVPYKVLRDGEAIVINGTQERIVGRPQAGSPLVSFVP